jgi:hypothetical protein
MEILDETKFVYIMLNAISAQFRDGRTAAIHGRLNVFVYFAYMDYMKTEGDK